MIGSSCGREVEVEGIRGSCGQETEASPKGIIRRVSSDEMGPCGRESDKRVLREGGGGVIFYRGRDAVVNKSEGPAPHPADASVALTRNGTIGEKSLLMHERMSEPLALAANCR